MSLFGIIFYIIIIVIFINAKKAAKSGNNQKGAGSKNRVPGQYSGTSGIPNVPKKNAGTLLNEPKKKEETLPNVPKSGKTVVPNVPMKRKTDKKFMEPHREEKIQSKIRTNNLWGEDKHAQQRIVAIRLMEGDPVPEGYIRVKCPYCNADNLVTKNCKQYHSCYFCRVPID